MMRRAVFSLVAFAILGMTVLAADTVPDRFAKIRAGEWVLMQDVSGENIGEKNKISVVKVENGTIYLKRECFDAMGNVVDTREHEMSAEDSQRNHEKLRDKAKETSREIISIKDKEYSVISVLWEGEKDSPEGESYEYKIWVSEELPISGVAKFWSSNPEVPVAEVVDFGF